MLMPMVYASAEVIQFRMARTATWGHGVVIPAFQLPGAMSKSIVLLQPQSVLKSMAPVTTKDS